MFRCGICHGLSQPRDKAIRVVLLRDRIIHPEKGNHGTRIVKEVFAHETCALEHENIVTKPLVIDLEQVTRQPFNEVRSRFYNDHTEEEQDGKGRR